MRLRPKPHASTPTTSTTTTSAPAASTSRSGPVSARLLVVALVAALVPLPSPSTAVAELQHPLLGDVPTTAEVIDVRDTAADVPPTAAQRAAADALDATVRWSRFGTPRSVLATSGVLVAGVDGADAADAALAFVEAQQALFGIDDLETLEVDRVVPLTEDAAAVVLRQRIDVRLVSPDGTAVVGLRGAPDTGWDIAYASSTLVTDTSLAAPARLSATSGWIRAAEHAGTDVATEDVETEGTRRGWTVLDVADLDQDRLVRPVAFPTPDEGVRPAYEATVVDTEGQGIDHGERVIVDAVSGERLFATSIVDHAADDPAWEVFPSWPPTTPLNRYPWNYPSADTRQVWCWTGGPGCRLALAGSSPHPDHPWDVDPASGAPTFTTTGNYADSQENWFDFLFPVPGGYQPTSATRDYRYAWTNEWFRSGCDPDVLEVGSGNDIDAATANLFAMHSRFHNWSYHLGFTDHTWNGQDDNFGVGTADGDPLIGMVQAGAVSHGPPTYAGRDNAFMRTLPDGTPSQTAMFLWQPVPGAFYAPCVDGDYDMAVIGHEYTHMIENRMIGKGFNRTGFHVGAMGESVADLIAMEYLNQYGHAPGGDAGWVVGAYVTGNPIIGIRNYNLAFASSGAFPGAGRDDRVNPLNLSNVGYDVVGPHVHADGEIWSATHFDLRELFAGRYGGSTRLQRECADGQRDASQCPGNRRWMQLMFDAFLLMPTGPTFLDARDAMLAADQLRFGGANQDLLWLGFARRGFGEHAFVTGTQDSDPVPSWESPLHDEATLVFAAEAKDAGGAPITDAEVFVGHYEGRSTPAAVTADGEDTLRLVPPATGGRHGAYEFVARAEGHGHVRFRVNNVRAGQTRTITIRFPTNWASTHQGATASGDGVRFDDLIDDTEATNWESVGEPVQGREVVVELPGRQRFQRAKVSAHLLPGQNRFTALRAFELHACTASATVACAAGTDAGWRVVHRSRADAFPGANPRPVAPQLILRSFELPTTEATHVRLRVVDNQCTGQSSFHGKQDADPRHETDRRLATPLPPRDTEVRIAELQLHSSRPQVAGAQQVD